jgi:hypothetical protein
MIKRLIAILLSIVGISPVQADSLNNWSVSQFTQDEQQLVVRHLSRMPSDKTVGKFPWLAVIEWKYEANSDGMPVSSKSMVDFEDEVINLLEAEGLCVTAIVKTGHGIREFNLFINNRDDFMKRFNSVFSTKPAMPIRINFYKEPRWESLLEIVGAHK